MVLLKSQGPRETVPTLRSYDMSRKSTGYRCLYPGPSPFKLPPEQPHSGNGVLIVQNPRRLFGNGKECSSSIIRNLFLSSRVWKRGKVDYNKECVEESRRLKPGSCPLTGSPKPPMWASIQLFSHAGPFLQMLPHHLPQGPSRITAFSTPDSPLSSLICILVLHSKNLSLLENERLV